MDVRGKVHGQPRSGESRPARRRRRTTLKDDVAAYIRERILSGEAAAGSKIDIDGIAEEMDVSTLPVRQAIIQLESEGLIENRNYRGNFVAMLSPEDVQDHYQAYGLVSGVAVSRAASVLSTEQIDELDEIVTRMEQSDDFELLEQLNIEFHRRLNRAGASRRLTSILRTLANSLPGTFYEFAPGWRHQANEHHRQILRHLRNRDADAAARAVAEHFRAGGDFAVSVLKDRGYWQS
jgi:DNA-binding GntR family transcriptional regulator